MQESKEFPNTVVSSGISASWLLNACVIMCFKVWNDTVCWTTAVNKSCVIKQLADSGGLRETAEIYSHSPLLPACSEHIFKLSYWYQSKSKLELSESWSHQLIVCFFLFQTSFSASMQTKQIAVSCGCDKSHKFFCFSILQKSHCF